MSEIRYRRGGWLLPLAMASLLAACTAPQPRPPQAEIEAPCAQAQPDAALAGKWLAVRRHKGVAGELHILFTLEPDGTMAYAEQLRRGKAPPRALRETGCWSRQGDSLVLQTLESNGVPVERDDPIYRNTYRIVPGGDSELRLEGPEGPLRARRMGPGYHLPY